jgi:hypothetical protein
MFHHSKLLRLIHTTWGWYNVTNMITNQDTGPGKASTWRYPPALIGSQPTMREGFGQVYIYIYIYIYDMD